MRCIIDVHTETARRRHLSETRCIQTLKPRITRQNASLYINPLLH